LQEARAQRHGARVSAVLGTLRADLCSLEVDAIVNAANAGLQGGGGVDGAVHRAAGPRLLEACRAIGGCASGDAVLTPGFELPARWVIHAVGPIWRGGAAGEDATLASCYRRSLELAREHGFASLAFSALSTGVYGFPRPRAARIAVESLRAGLGACPRLERVWLVALPRRARPLVGR
jgi:O-acetyl-ADP-ribose deacetylase (regulator of RNase III)